MIILDKATIKNQEVILFKANNNMQYEATTPTEYLDVLDDDWRKEKLQELRNLICKQAPDLKEGIEYKMLAYYDEKGVMFHLNAQKNYVSLYVGNAEKIDPEKKLLSGLNVGKGCIRFKKSVVISDTQIEEFIKCAVDLWKKGEDIGC